MSSFTVRCWGCNYSETHPWEGPGPEYDAIIEDMRSRGWQHREFGPGANPWFCSNNCAYTSYNAVQAQEYWQQKEFEDYCEETKIPPIFWAPLLFAAILIGVALLGECIHAGIQ